jgi:uncharacterized membrane protein
MLISLVKALTYRILGTLITAGIAFLYTQRIGLSTAIGATDFIAKISAYFIHEELWRKFTIRRAIGGSH